MYLGTSRPAPPVQTRGLHGAGERGWRGAAAPSGTPRAPAASRARASLSPFHVGPTHSPVHGGEGLAAAVSTWAAPKGAQGTADSVERTPEGQSSDTHTPEPSGHLAVPSQPPESMATRWPHAS